MRGRNVLRQPALHFLLIGAAIFAASPSTAPRATPGPTVRAPIVIPASTIAELRKEHQLTIGEPPTTAELESLLAREADREILYREALLLGLDRADPAVERRVIEKMRFLYGDDAGTDAEAFTRGLEIGLHRDDIVVRRTLVIKMRLLAKRASVTREPTGTELDQALEAHLAAHADRYRQPAAISLRHVFFSTERRGARADEDATAWQARRGRTPPADGESLGGDVFALGHELRHQSPQALAKMFGRPFADRTTTLATRTWSAPVRSSYGTHILWISDRTPARVPPLSAVRARVLRGYRAEQHEIYLGELMVALRSLYEIRTAPVAPATEADA